MELYLKGNIVQVSKDISQTKQVNDLSELKDRQANYTSNVKAKATPEVTLLLEQLGIVGNSSRIPYQKVPAKIVEGGIEIVSDGYAVFKSYDEEYYNFTVYDGNVSLSETLKGKKLNGLDYSALNHVLDFDSFLSSQQNTGGYVHAMADFGTMDGDVFEIDFNPGAIYIHTLWEMIFEQAGLSYSGAIFTNPKFLRTAIVPQQGIDVPIQVNDSTDMGDIDTNNITVNQQIDENGYTVNQDFTFNGTANDIINNTSDLTFGFSGICKVQIGYTLDVDAPMHQESIKLLLNGIVIDVVYSSGTKTYTLHVNQGDKLTMNLDVYAWTVSGTENLLVNASSTLSFKHVTTTGINIDYAAILPDMQQTDFLKDVMQHFGLMFRHVPNTNQYEFIQIESLLSDRQGAEDWSKKFISSSQSYSVMGYAQENKLKYSYDDDKESYADGTIVVNNEIIQSSKDLFTSPFKASKLYGQIGNTNIYSLPLYETKEKDGTVTYTPKQGGARWIEIKDSTDTFRIKILNSDNFVSKSGLKFMDFSECGYQTYVDLYYQKFKSMMDNFVKESGIYKVDIVDLYNLDFFKLKFIEQLGGYYYLNKVVFVKGKQTKVELLKVS